MKFILIVFLPLFQIAVCSAASYYVDAGSGSDEYDGSSPEKAWKSLSKVNSAMLEPGDIVLLKRACVWRGAIKPVRSGSPGKPICYGAYGEGESPKVFGSVEFELPPAGENENLISKTDFELVDDGKANGGMKIRSLKLAPGKRYMVRFSGRSDGKGSLRLVLRQEQGMRNYLHKSSSWDKKPGYHYLISKKNSDWREVVFNFTTPPDYDKDYWLLFENVENSSVVKVKDASLKLLAWENVQGDEYRVPYYVSRKIRIPAVAVWIKDGQYVKLKRGAARSLKAGEWDWRDSMLSVSLAPGIKPEGERIECSRENAPFDISADVSHIKVENIDFYLGNMNGIGLRGKGTDIQVVNCSAFFNGNDGINGHGKMTDVIIDKCTVKNNGQGWAKGGAPGDGISFHNRCTGIIRNCVIENNDKGGIYNIGDSVFFAENNLLKNNCVNLVVGGSSTKEHYFFNNICVNKSGSKTGFRIGRGCKAKVFFYNNIMYGDGSGVGIRQDGGSFTARNNIVVNWETGIEKSSGTSDLDYNDVWNNKTNYLNSVAGPRSISEDPLFEAPDNCNFSLKPASPCLGKGCEPDLGKFSEELPSLNKLRKNIGLMVEK